MTPKIDKEFASLIPSLTEDEYTQLEANIVSEGCRDALVVWGDILIDGHNRLQICTKYRLPYNVIERDFEDRNEAKKYIILNQLGRRNLTLARRGMLYLELEPLYKAEAKKNQRRSAGRGKKGPQKGCQNSDNLFASVHSLKEIGKQAGISHDTVARVKKIVKEGTPEQVERVKSGGKGNSIRAVYNEVRHLDNPPSGLAAEIPADSAVENGNLPDSGVCDNLPDNIADNSPPKDSTESQKAPDDNPETGGVQDDLEKIKGYVTDLKNPDLDRTYTTAMFLTEFEAFTERFIRSIGTFHNEPYKEIYPLLSGAERKKLTARGAAMIKAIEKLKFQ